MRSSAYAIGNRPDGYAAALALGEIDPHYEGKQVTSLMRAANRRHRSARSLVVPGDAHGGRRCATLRASTFGSNGEITTSKLWGLSLATCSTRYIGQHIAVREGIFKPRLAKGPRQAASREKKRETDEVFFIILGEVRVTIYSLAGKVVSFRELGPGEVFGEYPAIDRGPRSASVEARTPCLVATLPGSAFRELIESEPVVALAMLPQLVTKIRALTARVYEFSTLAVSNRIQAELLRLASLGAKEGRGARIAPVPTHTEIAARVSTHREAVTRELTQLVRIGLIEREKNALVVTDLERLAEMVHAATGE